MASDPNLDRVWAAYKALAEGDVEPMGDLLADDVKWHIPGKNQFSGDLNGRAEVLASIGKRQEKSGGTFRSDVHDIIANDRHVIVLSRFSAEREGKKVDMTSVNVFHLNDDGKFAERSLFVEDQEAINLFWS